MTTRVLGCAVLTVALVVAASWVWGIGSSAAQENPAASTEWPPRTADGHPDIQGVWGSADGGGFSWHIEPEAHLLSLDMPQERGLIQSASGSVQSPGEKLTLVVDPPSGILPYQPWALERRNSVLMGHLHPEPWQIDPQTRGWPNGVPRAHIYSSLDGSVGGPFHILQPPGYVVFLYETQHEFRVVPLDGRPQPGTDVKLWMGSSRGRWEGHTLVIETTNHNDSTRFDVVGDFHSDEMRVTERWTYVDQDTLEYRATIDDPQVYTRPWTLAIRNVRTPAGTELLEYAGVEGDQNATIATEEAARRAGGPLEK